MARSAAHYLESWGDALTSDGDYLAIQPMILPLFGGVSEIELLNALLGGPKTEGPELVQETFRATNPPGDFQTAWSRFLHDGFASHVQPRDQASSFNSNAAGGVAQTLLDLRAGADARIRPRLCWSAVMQWTTAATPITAGFRKCRIQSRN